MGFFQQTRSAAYLPGFFFGLIFFDIFFDGRCCGGAFTTSPAARSNRAHASGCSSISLVDGAFAMAPPKIYMPFLHDHAAAIGYLCIMYNALENRVNQSLEILSGLDETETRIFTNQIDLLKKVPILNALAFSKKPSDLWFEDIELMGWAITSHIIPKRNRFVHDQWLSLPSGTMRLHERTRISKSQSRQPQQLSTSERIDQSSNEIWELVQHTKDVANILRHLNSSFESGRAAREPEKAFPQSYRDQWSARRTPPKESNSTTPSGPAPEQ